MKLILMKLKSHAAKIAPWALIVAFVIGYGERHAIGSFIFGVTANMSLDLPTVGVTTGPTYATKINDAFTTVDSHDHSSGKGALVPMSGLNVAANLDMEPDATAYGVLDAKWFACKEQASTPAQANSLWCDTAGDLYYRDDGGNDVQITDGGAISASTIGGFGGDYTSSTAVANYVTATKAYTFLQDTAKTADIIGGQVGISENGVASSKIIYWKAPGSLAADYTMTLPGALPSTNTSVLTLTTAGTGAMDDLRHTRTETIQMTACSDMTYSGAGPASAPLLDPATDEACIFHWMVPEDFVGTTVDVSFWFSAPSAAGGNNVVLDFNMSCHASGSDHGNDDHTESVTIGSWSATDELVEKAWTQVTHANLSPGGLTSGNMCSVEFYRDADNGSDNYGSAIRVVAVTITYTSTVI